jgi:hypothetical protein
MRQKIFRSVLSHDSIFFLRLLLRHVSDFNRFQKKDFTNMIISIFSLHIMKLFHGLENPEGLCDS